MLVNCDSSSSSSSSSSSCLSFNEEDTRFMELLSESIASLISKVFPLNIPNINDSKLNYSPMHKLSNLNLKNFLNLIEVNLGSFYIKNKGSRWKLGKLEEMKDSGLVYLWYSNSKNEIIGFISFSMTYSYRMKVLYLYEIHVAPKYQSLKVGSLLIGHFHKFSSYLNSQTNSNIKYSSYFNNDASGLTVFSDNLKALNWYFKLGYDYTDDSPRDKVLRSGKIVKPEYYLLIRPNQEV